MDSKRIYKGIIIIKDHFAYRVQAGAWGDQPGENIYSFKALTAAKAFIDRMEEDFWSNR